MTNYYKQAVYDPKESKIGDIDDVLVDKSGKIGLVIGVGGFLGAGEKDVIVPFTAVKTAKRLTLDETKDDLKGAPGFKLIEPAPPGLRKADKEDPESGACRASLSGPPRHRSTSSMPIRTRWSTLSIWHVTSTGWPSWRTVAEVREVLDSVGDTCPECPDGNCCNSTDRDTRLRMDRTFILTAELEAASFAWLDGLRREHFPPERNLLPAPLTLFHRLSSAQTGRLDAIELSAAPVPLFEEPVLLGFGVAVRIRSPELDRLRAAACGGMGGEFSRQDSQAWRPHVTIQNKATADAARQLHRTFEHGFEPRPGSLTGLLVWELLGGPWKLVRRLLFDQ
ncbi:2'-5' RNA ligase family protein [Bradyrhizobium sp. 2TAF36]|uniref:2'-5' RNA ligase family protein n=1 Tax=Bradyrhizobium sp. 2TAF36 TaxID=3233016 RepID=UPI003F9056CE